MLRRHDSPLPLGQIPVTVITSLVKPEPEFRAEWQAMQDELAALAPDTVRIDAGDAGHFVHQDNPDLVVQAIAELVKRCR